MKDKWLIKNFEH